MVPFDKLTMTKVCIIAHFYCSHFYWQSISCVVLSRNCCSLCYSLIFHHDGRFHVVLVRRRIRNLVTKARHFTQRPQWQTQRSQCLNTTQRSEGIEYAPRRKIYRGIDENRVCTVGVNWARFVDESAMQGLCYRFAPDGVNTLWVMMA